MASYPTQNWITRAQVSYQTILHIDDEWAHALIVEVRPESSLIIGAARERRLEIGPTIRASTLVPVCEDALRRAEDMTGRVIGHVVVPDEALLSIGGAHIDGVACGVQSKRTEPDKLITRREVQRLLGRLHEAGWAAMEQTVADADPPVALEVVQAEVVETQVDGIAVTNPVRFRGERLDASGLLLFARTEVMDELRALATVLKLEARFVAVVWAVANLRVYPHAIGLVLDTHQTSVFRMQGEQITCMETCAYGSQDLERDLAVNLGLPQFRATALRRAYTDGKLDEEASGILGHAMHESIRRWFRAMEGPLAKLAEQGPLAPRLCYWEIAPAWPGMGNVLATWMETWGLDVFPVVLALGLEDVPWVGDRTGIVESAPSATVLFALANHAGRIRRGPNTMNAMLHRMAKR